jgi:hypothetical protein
MKINLWWTLAAEVTLNLIVLLYLAGLTANSGLIWLETVVFSLSVLITASLITHVEKLEKVKDSS